MSATYSMPTRILSGKGCIVSNSALLLELGRHALIVTGRTSAQTNGALADVTAALEKEHMHWTLFDRIEANPSTETVREAAAFGRDAGADLVIGIGGGSPMDAAKAISALLTHTLEGEALFGGIYPNPVPPIVCVPTTAGTGSEVTPYAILTDHATRSKRNMSGAALFPKLSFLDASYMLDLPWDVTLHTAVDALSHAAEGFLSLRGTVLSEPFARSGLRQMGQVLRQLAEYRNQGVLAAGIPFSVREQALVGSMFSGITIAQTGTTVLHAMGYCLTYYRNIGHGHANALLMPAYFEWLEKKTPARMASLFEPLGFASAESFSRFLHPLFEAAEPLQESEIQSFASLSLQAKSVANTPVQVSFEELVALFRSCRLP